MAGYIYGGYNGYTSGVSGFTDNNYYGSGATTVDFTQINLHSGGTWNYTIELQRGCFCPSPRKGGIRKQSFLKRKIAVLFKVFLLMNFLVLTWLEYQFP
ncbi:hypothetical protein [Bacillus sp. RC252]|uniref:hypothetical protein n=1 Tax=Bacillus sp. RC252 TaxID=3156289 RepID=UPI003836FF3E